MSEGMAELKDQLAELERQAMEEKRAADAYRKRMEAALDESGRLQQHVSELEKSLETARHEVAQMDAALRVTVPEIEARLSSTCVWCGTPAPDPTSAQAMRSHVAAHVLVCSQHPMRALEKSLEQARKERDVALADNAALVGLIREDATRGKDGQCIECGWIGHHPANCKRGRVAREHGHPGAALLEEHRKEVDGLLKEIGTLDGKRMQAQRAAQYGQSALHNVLEKLREDLARHGVQCVEGGLVGILNGIDRVAVRARNEGLEKVRDEVARQAVAYAAMGSERARDRHMLLSDLARDIAALKEPEGGQS